MHLHRPWHTCSSGSSPRHAAARSGGMRVVAPALCRCATPARFATRAQTACGRRRAWRWLQGRWGEACEQYQAMLRQTHCPPPDADTFTIMLWACLDQRDALCALRIVQDASSVSQPMRAAAVKQLIALLQDCGMQDAAAAMLRAVAQ